MLKWRGQNWEIYILTIYSNKWVGAWSPANSNNNEKRKKRRWIEIEVKFSLALIDLFNNLVPFFQYTYNDRMKMDSKGRDEDYAYIFSNMVSIDLSNNQLNWNVRSTLGKLKGLKVLNLSMNNLNGTIPNNIAQLS